MGERRLRSVKRKQRAKAEFWDRHGDGLRLGLIGGATALVASAAIWVFVSLI